MITVIRVDGTDITDDVILDDAQFESIANGEPGQGVIRVKDIRGNLAYNPRTLFKTGKEVTVTVDGTRVWGGFITQISYQYAFEAADTTIPEDVPRFFVLACTDYNLLFSRRMVWDQDDPTNDIPNRPAGTQDNTVISWLVANYLDLTGDGIDTSSGVTHVGTPGQYEKFKIASIGDDWGQVMQRIGLQTGAVWYIDPDKVLQFRDDETVTAPKGLSDRPGVGQVGYREMEVLSSATDLANDVFFWGAGAGSAELAFVREQRSGSIAAHGRFQYAELRYDCYKQTTVQKIADSWLDGSPQHRRGHKDDHDFIKCVVYSPVFRVGMVVAFESETHGYTDDVPVRKISFTWPSPDAVRFELELSHELDQGLSFAEWPPYGGNPWRPHLPWTDTFPVPGWEVGEDPDGWIMGGGTGGDWSESYANASEWVVGWRDNPGMAGRTDYANFMAIPWVWSGVYMNHPWWDNPLGCGVGVGSWGPEMTEQEVWFGWSQILPFWIPDGGLTGDMEFDLGSLYPLGAATSLEVRVDSDESPPAAGDYKTRGQVVGTITLPPGGGDVGTVRIPWQKLVDGVKWLIFSPGWSAGGGQACDASYSIPGAGVSPPLQTGQFGSGEVLMFSFWSINKVPPLYPGNVPGAVVGDWPTSDNPVPGDYDARWTTTYPYVPGSLTVTFDGVALQRGSEYGEISPADGTFWVSIPGDLRTASGGSVIASYTRADRYGGTTGGDDAGDLGDYDGTPGSTGNRVYRPAFVSQLGWGYADDGLNCVAASGCMALDRQTMGRSIDEPHLLRAAVNPEDWTGGLNIPQIQQALSDRWGQDLLYPGIISFEAFVRYLNEGRGALVIGDSHAFIPWNLEARSEYTGEIFVGPHATFINEQRENGDFYVYDPAFRPHSKYHISPGWYPPEAVAAYLAVTAGTGRAYALFTRRTIIL